MLPQKKPETISDNVRPTNTEHVTAPTPETVTHATISDDDRQSMYRILETTFGYTSFRTHQAEIIQSILSTRDVFAVMPTGAGKSLCYQLPALILDGTAVIVSPLISLMKDQVDAAQQNGIKAAFINSSLNRTEFLDILDQLRGKNLDLLYAAPERFAVDTFIEELQKTRIAFFAIDEAHCISQWGHDFRPDYLRLNILKTTFPATSVAAFTATATSRVQKDIITRLELTDPLIVRASFDRPNLYYGIQRRENPYEQVLDIITARSDQSGIVYCMTRKTVDRMTQHLQNRGINAVSYHAGLSQDERRNNQERFNQDEVQVIVATIAFGMGIDKSNIRFIVHVDLPKDLEHYYQETGRAGRDGEKAECILLYKQGDVVRLKTFIQAIKDEEERKIASRKLNRMAQFGLNCACRRKQILAYFGETYPKDNCRNCDVCLGQVQTEDITTDAQKILSAIYRTGQRFGATHIIDIVSGADTQKIKQYNHQNIKTYGVGQDKPKRFWRYIIDELIGQSIIEQKGDRYPHLAITTTGKSVLKGETTVNGARVTIASTSRGTTHGTIPGGAALETTIQEYDETLFQNLRKIRSELAHQRGVPPYIIFSDKSLHHMSATLPRTPQEFSRIHGVGQKKLREFGPVFLENINIYLENKDPNT